MTTKDLILIHDGQKTTLYLDRTDPVKPVIIKLLRNPDPDQSELSILLNEYSLTHDLQLSEVRQVYGKGIVEDRQAIFLEYVDGFPLKKAATEWAQNLDDKLNIATALATAVSRIHARGIIHRDLTSNNVIVSKTEAGFGVKLIDFAFARRLHAGQSLPSGERPEGTLAYISPEQTGRLSRSVDHRSDLYSLGVVLYELFTETLPFKLDDPVELLHAHLAKTPESPEVHLPGFPKILSRIILQLLEKEPEARYASAEGLARDLEKCRQSLKEGNDIEAFSLSVNSATHLLSLPNALYERNEENLRLSKFLERLKLGTHEYIRIKGETGTGKTSLAMGFGQYVNAAGGYFVTGSFDERTENEPLGAFIHALEDLVHQLLAEDAGNLERWKRNLRSALGKESAVICSIIPDLSLILGTEINQGLEAPAAANRLRQVFLRFIQAIGSLEMPVVFFPTTLSG
ncbi:MAG: protein kinase [Bacteroidia bacterium]